MKFTNIPSGASVFIDANVLVRYFTADPVLGSACEALLLRVENKDIEGYTSAIVVGETAHRLMTIEACATFGWPVQGIAQRLRNHPAEVQTLSRYRQAIDEVPLIPLHVLAVSYRAIALAADVSRQFGLLCNDAAIIAVMRENGLVHLASQDTDFDRVAGITRYSPN